MLRLIAALLCMLPLAAAADSVPASGRLAFKIVRDGSQIGTHVLEFREIGDRLEVTGRVDVAVKVAFITVYRYEERLTEVWEGPSGPLHSFTMAVNDDGERRAVSGRREGDAMLVETSGGTLRAPADVLPVTYWNRVLMGRDLGLYPTSGEIKPIAAREDGEDRVPGPSGPVTAMRYLLDDGSPKELWYDEDGTWVRLRLTARDGSTIVYEPL